MVRHKTLVISFRGVSMPLLVNLADMKRTHGSQAVS